MILKNNILYGGDRNYEIPNISYGEYYLESIKKFGHKVAVIQESTGAKLYYDEIVSKTYQVGTNLRKMGFKKGDIVATCLENRIDFALPAIGGLIVGLTLSPVNPLYNERELNHALNILKPRAIICSKLTIEKLRKIKNQIKSLEKLIAFDVDNFSDPAIIPFSKLLETSQDFSDKNFVYEKCNPKEDTAFIFFSSGTTGLPKGVMLTHRNYLAVALNYLKSPYRSTTPEDIIVTFLPFFHSFGCITYFNNQLGQIKLVVMHRFDFESFLQAIEKYRVTFITVVPPICVLLAKSPLVDRYNLSSLKQIMCGAAPLPKDIAASVSKRLKTTPIRQGYGMTELTLSVTMAWPGHKITSVGQINPGIYAKVNAVLDVETKKLLGPYQEGELCFKGEVVMKGYLHNQEATNSVIDSEGYLHTGDIGYYDEDGYFFIIDRLKELIKYKAFQVAPAELESLILEHQGVQDVGVIGVPDENAGEVPMAFVVKQSNANLKEEEIIKFVASKVSPHKRLHGGVRFIDAIPKNPSGKILRKDLRNLMKTKAHL